MTGKWVLTLRLAIMSQLSIISDSTQDAYYTNGGAIVTGDCMRAE